MIRIASWNMAYWNHKGLQDKAWDYYLNCREADIFLFQEAHPPEALKGDASTSIGDVLIIRGISYIMAL